MPAPAAPRLLDPKNDYVFKRLLADSPALLSSLINAVRHDRPAVKLGDELELNLVELPKAEALRSLPMAVSAWVTFFERWNEETAMATIDEPAVRDALRKLADMSASPEEWATALSREKAIRDEASWRSWERSEGRAEGLAEGLAEGRQQGEATGRLHGESQLLERLLTRRFGPLPEALTEQLRSADAVSIERWSDRLLDASSLDQVFQAD